MRFIFFYKIFWHKNRETDKKCKENEVKILLFHNLQYKKEKLRDFLVGYTPVCEKKKRGNLIFLSSLSGWNTLAW